MKTILDALPELIKEAKENLNTTITTRVCIDKSLWKVSVQCLDNGQIDIRIRPRGTS